MAIDPTYGGHRDDDRYHAAARRLRAGMALGPGRIVTDVVA
jgi:hypothetical protein